MKNFREIFIILTVVLLSTGVAFGLPYNERQVTINSVNEDSSTNPGAEDGLQTIFNNIGLSDIDVTTDQESAALWTVSDGNVDTYLVSMFTGGTGEFGIYNSAGEKLELISGGPSVTGFPNGTPEATFQVNQLTGEVWIGSKYDSNYKVRAADGVGFSSFGFYWNSYYTEDDKNDGGAAHALAYIIPDEADVVTDYYRGDTSTTTFAGNNDWILAFEDYTDNDFNDVIFLVEDIEPVPEPGTMVLLGFGLIGLAAFGRKKSIFQK